MYKNKFGFVRLVASLLFILGRTNPFCHMEELAHRIAEILSDYHNYRGFELTPDKVLDWVSQFDEADRKFILEEFLYLLNKGIYISEAKARKILVHQIERISKEYGFKNVADFLINADFLRLQKDYKSQNVLLAILDEELSSIYGIGLSACGVNSKKYAVYIDDIVASGKTLYDTLEVWLDEADEKGIKNYQKIVDGQKSLAVLVFCTHNWNKALWRLGKHFDSDSLRKKTKFLCHYTISNHRQFEKQTLNFVFPLNQNNQSVVTYLKSLNATEHEEFAFRKPETPQGETFFSTAENRIRFENIFLEKGIALLNDAANKEDNQRPLGMTPPTYKILGTGTLFFTWRNISNTCPIVFWWKSSNWNPLFPLYKRGEKIKIDSHG